MEGGRGEKDFCDGIDFSSYSVSHEDKLQVTGEQPRSHSLIYSFARLSTCLEAHRHDFKFFSAHLPPPRTTPLPLPEV